MRMDGWKDGQSCSNKRSAECERARSALNAVCSRMFKTLDFSFSHAIYFHFFRLLFLPSFSFTSVTNSVIFLQVQVVREILKFLLFAIQKLYSLVHRTLTTCKAQSTHDLVHGQVCVSTLLCADTHLLIKPAFACRSP